MHPVFMSSHYEDVDSYLFDVSFYSMDAGFDLSDTWLLSMAANKNFMGVYPIFLVGRFLRWHPNRGRWRGDMGSPPCCRMVGIQ